MGLKKETLIPVVSDGIFIRKQASEDGKSIVCFFQVSDYIEEYDLEIAPEAALEKLSEEELISDAFVPNLKFTFKSEDLQKKKYGMIKTLKAFDRYRIFYAFSPQGIPGDRGVGYAKVKMRNLKNLGKAKLNFLGSNEENSSDSDSSTANNMHGIPS